MERGTLKPGSSPPEQRWPTFKWFFLKNLRSKTLGKIQNLDPHRLMSRLKIQQLQGFAVEHNCRLVVTGDTKQHHSVQWGDALRILERSGAIAQAALTKLLLSGDAPND